MNSAAGCFVEDTLIRLANGKDKTIKELANDFNNGIINYVFSSGSLGETFVYPIVDAFKTKHVNQICKLVLDNDKEIKCTPDHKFLLRDGTYKEAQYLTHQDSLMPLDIMPFNHHVKSVEILNEEHDVYDLTVPPLNNFALTAGVFVHNSAKAARYKEFQAVLPLRGKILNVSKAELGKILVSETIKSIAAAIGGGIGDKFDINNVRYDKIIMMCFTGDTKVKMLDGTVKTFEELADMEKENPGQTYWVYSVDKHGKFVPGEAHNPRMIKETNELVYVTLDNDNVVKCTPDHKFMLKDGSWKEAKDLQINDSLMPLYTEIAPEGYMRVYGDRELLTDSFMTYPTHRRVAEAVVDNLNDGNVVHHKDFNHFNNSPENLQWMTWSEHGSYHANLYNKSEKHKEDVKNAWENGSYDECTWAYTYNGTSQQKEMLQNMHLRPEIKEAARNKMIAYNKSQKHRDLVAAMNANKDMIELQQRGKIINCIAVLIRLCGTVNEDVLITAKKNKTIGYVPTMNNILTYFNSFDEMYELAIKYEKDCLTDEMVARLVNCHHSNVHKTKRNSMARIGKMLFDEGKEFNEDNFELKRKELKTKAPRFSTHAKYFDSYEDFVNTCRCYNHKVKNIEFVHCDTPVKTYCLTVKDYHNFGIDVSSPNELNDKKHSMIIVSNCDADVDGLHIRSLLLTFFYYYMTKLITHGHVYAAIPPLYRVIKKDTTSVYLVDDDALEKYRKEHAGENYVVNRFKGLGEMNPEELKISATNPQTRTLMRITIEDAEEAARTFEILMGKDASLRKAFIEENAFSADLSSL